MSLPKTPEGIVMGLVRNEHTRQMLGFNASPLKFTQAFTAPDEIDPEPYMETEDQVQVGSCTGQTESSIGEYLNIVHGGDPVKLSAMASYLFGQEVDNMIGQDNGCSIRGSVEGAIRFGYVLEALCPYTGKYFQSISKEAREFGLTQKAEKYVEIRNYADMFTAISSGIFGGQIGIDWTQELADNTTGIIEQARGQVYGGHSVSILGYTKRVDSQGRKYLKLLNSHGKRWGRNGWAEVAPAQFDRWGQSQNAEMVAVTKSKTFTPQAIHFKGRRG